REPGRDVCREHRRREKNRVEAALSHERLERVDPRLRQRFRQKDVLHHVHARRPETRGLPGQARDLGAEQHGLHLAVERGGLGQHAERILLQLPFVVLEEDQRLHKAFFYWRYARTFSAAVLSSSILTVSPRAGASPSS